MTEIGMEATIFLKVLFLIYEINKNSRSVILFDCNLNTCEMFFFFNFIETILYIITLFSAKNVTILKMASANNVVINAIDLDSIESQIYFANIIFEKYKSFSFLGIAINYNCNKAKDFLEMVNNFY